MFVSVKERGGGAEGKDLCAWRRRRPMFVLELTWNTFVLPLKTILVEGLLLAHLLLWYQTKICNRLPLPRETTVHTLPAHTHSSIYFTPTMWKTLRFYAKLQNILQTTMFWTSWHTPKRSEIHPSIHFWPPWWTSEQRLRNTLSSILILLGWLHLTASEQLEDWSLTCFLLYDYKQCDHNQPCPSICEKVCRINAQKLWEVVRTKGGFGCSSYPWHPACLALLKHPSPTISVLPIDTTTNSV